MNKGAKTMTKKQLIEAFEEATEATLKEEDRSIYFFIGYLKGALTHCVTKSREEYYKVISVLDTQTHKLIEKGL